MDDGGFMVASALELTLMFCKVYVFNTSKTGNDKGTNTLQKHKRGRKKKVPQK
eukprot:m.264046 g.264046  ORF g.264046 m.264046 type:complete len:53 (+) comp53594_c0_seq1:97-255(+)